MMSVAVGCMLYFIQRYSGPPRLTGACVVSTCICRPLHHFSGSIFVTCSSAPRQVDAYGQRTTDSGSGVVPNHPAAEHEERKAEGTKIMSEAKNLLPGNILALH
jgi:hypothetical protein